MAFLTFDEAKVVAPPIVPRNTLITDSKSLNNNDESADQK